MNQLRTQKSIEATDELWALANGPVGIVNTYSGCICDGVRFHTFECDSRRKSQNSGLVVEGEGHKTSFYGRLCKVWEMTYLFGYRVVLFQCEWFNSGSNRTFRVEPHSTSIDVRSRWFKDDPFVLPSQVQQVFYVNDTLLGDHWKIVERIRRRGIWDVPERDEPELNDVEDMCRNDNVFQHDETNVVAPVYIEDDADNSLSRSGVEIIQEKEILESITRALDKGIVDDVNVWNDEDDDEIQDEDEAEDALCSDTDVDIES